jgi:hypothetical protein
LVLLYRCEAFASGAFWHELLDGPGIYVLALRLEFFISLPVEARMSDQASKTSNEAEKCFVSQTT